MTNTTETPTRFKIKRTKEWRRPVNINLEVRFSEDNRKVTPRDLENAAIAAAAAARTVLESTYYPYSIDEIDGQVEYSYVQSRKSFKG